MALRDGTSGEASHEMQNSNAACDGLQHLPVMCQLLVLRQKLLLREQQSSTSHANTPHQTPKTHFGGGSPMEGVAVTTGAAEAGAGLGRGAAGFSSDESLSYAPRSILTGLSGLTTVPSSSLPLEGQSCLNGPMNEHHAPNRTRANRSRCQQCHTRAQR